MSSPPDLVGIAEISAEFGVARSTVSMWDARRSVTHFPHPLARLASGPVYDMTAVREWHENRPFRLKETAHG